MNAKGKILPIAIYGHPALRVECDGVNMADPAEREDVLQLIADMRATLGNTETGVGVAACQVARTVRVMLVFEDAYINPVILEEKGSRKFDSESCLSLPGLGAPVERWQKVRLAWTDEHGNKQERLFKGFEARVIQHEVDHLNGIHYFDNVKDKTILFKKNIEEIMTGKSEELETVKYPIIHPKDAGYKIVEMKTQE